MSGLSALLSYEKAPLKPPSSNAQKQGEIGKNIIYNLAIGIFSTIPAISLLPPAKTVCSDKVFYICDQLFTKPIEHAIDFLEPILPSVDVSFNHGICGTLNLNSLATCVALEEVIFRGIIQSTFLTDIPRLALKQIAPKYQGLVDHKIVKIARSIFTAILFALAHGCRLGMYPGMLVPQLCIGFFYSYLRENKTSLAKLTAIHFAYDIILLSMCGGLPTCLDAKI